MAGLNSWLGHNNSSGKLKRTYIDCHWGYNKMHHDRVNCSYASLDEIKRAKRRRTACKFNKEIKCSKNHHIMMSGMLLLTQAYLYLILSMGLIV